MEISRSKGVKKENERTKIRRSYVNWQGTLKEKGVKQGLWAPQCDGYMADIRALQFTLFSNIVLMVR